MSDINFQSLPKLNEIRGFSNRAGFQKFTAFEIKIINQYKKLDECKNSLSTSVNFFTILPL